MCADLQLVTAVSGGLGRVKLLERERSIEMMAECPPDYPPDTGVPEGFARAIPFTQSSNNNRSHIP
jgi:hypothetical protein